MIDGKPIRQVFPALEADPYLAFDVKGTNLYFKNGVSIGKHLLSILMIRQKCIAPIRYQYQKNT